MYDEKYIERAKRRFLGSFNKGRRNSCWVWTGSRVNGKYGKIYFMGRTHLATHVAWFFEHGKFPERGDHVCHSCDNPPCVNPNHLWLGTGSANQNDSVKKGRHASTKKSRCIHGHTLKDAFIYRGKRECRTCRKEKYSRRLIKQAASLGMTMKEFRSPEREHENRSHSAKIRASKIDPGVRSQIARNAVNARWSKRKEISSADIPG